MGDWKPPPIRWLELRFALKSVRLGILRPAPATCRCDDPLTNTPAGLHSPQRFLDQTSRRCRASPVFGSQLSRHFDEIISNSIEAVCASSTLAVIGSTKAKLRAGLTYTAPGSISAVFD